MRSALIGGLFTALMLGHVPATAADAEFDARRDAAMAATQQLFETLSGELQAAMEQGGPAAAIGVCRDIAPEINARLSRETGWQVKRVGTRVRNPMLGMPDAWEQRVLKSFEARRAQGEALPSITHAEVIEEPDGRYFRFMRAIGMQPQCLACHGATETLDKTTRAALNSDYPHDRATGYQPGDLRGAFSIKQPMTIPLIP